MASVVVKVCLVLEDSLSNSRRKIHWAVGGCWLEASLLHHTALPTGLLMPWQLAFPRAADLIEGHTKTEAHSVLYTVTSPVVHFLGRYQVGEVICNWGA